MLLNLLVTQAVNATADGKPHLHAFFCFSPLTLWCNPTPLLSLSRGLLQFRSFGVMTVLLMFSSLHPSFFPSIMFFLAILIVILLISSQEIQANRWNAGHFSRNAKGLVGKDSCPSWFGEEIMPHWMGSSLTSPGRNHFAASCMSATHSRRQVRKTLLAFPAIIVLLSP